MAQVTITINSREYAVACEDGQELRIIQLAKILDEKARALTGGSMQVNEGMLLAMVGLMLADELTETKKNGSNSHSEDNNKTLENLCIADKNLAEQIKNLQNKLNLLASELNLL
ncbi:MAG: cell division protein ZapA [Alphaproteobacteria bacterium]|nr:cell division protein ZapA [Alphaproteobacteria bacterium]